jgi:hypothetical protein
MVDVLGQRLDRRILGVLGGVVDRDAVLRQPDLARQEGLIVGRVEPGQRARDEGLVELLGSRIPLLLIPFGKEWSYFNS